MIFLKAIRQKLTTIYKMFYLTGFWGVLTIKPLPKTLTWLLFLLGINLKNQYIKLHLKGYNHPIFYRYGSSDPSVFHLIFIQEEYSCLNDIENPRFIIDCGANVGYSSLYFLKKYPNAHVIAVEPDDENFKVCKKNLSSYSDQVSLILSGIWSHRTSLIVEKNDGRGECEIQVKECETGQKPNLDSICIESLLKDFGINSIDLLKIDIEGSERVIFAKNYQNWLPLVKNIVIELHGKKCEDVFFQALSTYDYELSRFGELTICKRITPKATVLVQAVLQ